MSSFKVNVNPDIIKWSIKAINMPEDILVKKMGIKKSTFKKWIDKEDRPTYVQLQKLSKIVKIAPLAFMSEKVPLDIPMGVFRDYNGKIEKSYDTLLKIKQIKFYQDVVETLDENLGMQKEPDIEFYSIDSDPEEVAIKERKKFLSLSNQEDMKDKYMALNEFRSNMENQNIFVMQMSFNDIRGFSLTGKNPVFIVLNSKEDPTARLFTLFHEYAHILIRKNESDIVNSDYAYFSSSDNIETWCNNFASYFLMSDSLIIDSWEKYENIEKVVNYLSNKYKLSYSMIFYRLYKLNYITDYKDAYNKFIENKKKENNKKAKVNYYTKVRSGYGNKYINLVNDNYLKNEITLSDALMFLNIKISGYDQLMEKVNKWNI
ncbi:ImmA/IrrE family metallo-endopeptidase [Ferroplasma sp.]|uniref:ImmA/IrrE family metallo-endopeptidase n=1 Tax=Ferroplasma sp. TaxID=2591003 RepID=UPI00307CDEB0